MELYDVVIIGSGAAGMTAGMYAARYRLKAVVIGKALGGETTTAWKVENYPGFASIDGVELVQKMKEHTEGYGVKVLDGEVTNIRHSGHCFDLATSLGVLQAKTVILAEGTLRRHLDLPREKELSGRGVHYCLTCDAPLYKDKVIAIVGGGDSSVKGANLAKAYARQIYLIVRGGELIGEPINLEELRGATNVEVIYDTEVKEIVGEEKLEKILLSQPYHGANELVVDGLFVEIGAEPNVELARQLGLELDEKGFIQVDSMMRTSIDGVFAAGDTTNFFGPFKQIVTAAAMGAVGATSAYQDIGEHKPTCEIHALTPPPFPPAEAGQSQSALPLSEDSIGPPPLPGAGQNQGPPIA